MKTMPKFTAAAAVLFSLSACDALGLGGGGANSSAAGNNAAAPAADMNMSSNAADSAGGKDPAAAGNVATASTAPFTGEVTRQFLVGRWTDNNDCSSTIEFRQDGSFVAPTGQGLWVLDGERLTFQGQRTVSARVQAPDANTITLIHEDGSLGRSTRCP